MGFHRPSFTQRDSLYLVQRLANELKAERGKFDVSLLDIRIKAALEEDTRRIDLDRLSRALRKSWERANHQIIGGRDGVVFVPGAFITVQTSLRMSMGAMAPADVIAWGSTEGDARDNYIRVMDARVRYRNARLNDFAAHPELADLLDVERGLHGYKPGHADDMPFGLEDDE